MNYNWKDEIKEFLEEKYIMNCEVEKEISQGVVILKIQTLENKIWEIESHYSNGIKIVNEEEVYKDKSFESFESLFNKISPLYKRKFLMDLNEM